MSVSAPGWWGPATWGSTTSWSTPSWPTPSWWAWSTSTATGRSRWRRRYETEAFSDHRDLIGRVDVASVAVPTEQHFHVARDLLEAGISVLVEKPMTPTLEEARELFAVAQRAGAILHVGHVERFNGAVDELKQIVSSPAPGRVAAPRPLRAARAEGHGGDGSHDPRHRHRAEPGGLPAACSWPRRGPSVHTEVADVATVQIRFASGAVATITASRATEEKIRTLAITQPDAYIVLDYTEQDIHIYRRAAQEYTMNRGSIRYRRASFVEHLKVHRDNPLKLEIQHLLGATRRRRAGERVTLAQPDDLRSLAMALEIERMIRDGVAEVTWREPVP